MTAPVDVANRALSEIGARTVISDFNTETSPAAVQCKLFYDSTRKDLLRAAPWNFARKTVLLTELGTLEANTAPYPWLVKYAHPADCIRLHYILPSPYPALGEGGQPNVSDVLVPWCPPSRQFRFLIAYDDSVTPPRRVVLANVPQAYGIYTANVQDPDLWDSLFEDAMTMALASKLVIPLTGNVALKQSYAALANNALSEARAVGGNEAISTTDHVVDWVAARSTYGGWDGGVPVSALGSWYAGYDSSWSM